MRLCLRGDSGAKHLRFAALRKFRAMQTKRVLATTNPAAALLADQEAIEEENREKVAA